VNSIYLIGSLRNAELPRVGEYLREIGFDVFDEWYSAGPEADDAFWRYAQARGWDYGMALKSYAARNIYAFDRTHIDRQNIGVLLMPAGRSGHLELGYMIGCGKPGYVLFDKTQERFDQMYQFTDGVFFDRKELGRVLLERHA
jgi:hypothetical protein